MKLHPHGVREIWTEGRILFSRNAGPFNLEHLQDATEESREERKRLTRTGPWGTVVIMSDSVMFTPEALDMIRDNMADSERNGELVAAAFVVPPGTEGRWICESLFAPIYGIAGAKFRLFEILPPASDWVLKVIDDARKARSSDQAEH
ncbi:hypothetical protein [Nisaea sp.]|uniref:hypothetical protein n=1 Tax=Nisaea sp. TaxID=2024842 RepID=UPI0032EFCE85